MFVYYCLFYYLHGIAFPTSGSLLISSVPFDSGVLLQKGKEQSTLSLALCILLSLL
jgi:hypothetical protein